MNRVLVTGASGFIGRHVLPILIDRNYDVHATYTTSSAHAESGIHWYELNLHETDMVSRVINEIKPSHLLHLAWYTNPVEYWTSQVNFVWLQSSLELLKSFIAAGGKRVVMAGTCAEYDWRDGYCSEYSTLCEPKTLYGQAKYNLWLESERLAREYGISLAWARLFYLFGEYENQKRLVPNAIHSFARNHIFEVKTGNHIRDFMYVRDVADALVALLDSPIKGTINIASGNHIRIGDFIGIIADKMHARNKLHIRNNIEFKDGYGAKIIADITRLRNELNWTPVSTLDDALSKTINWWSHHIQ